jgi:predicted ATPase
MQKLVIKTPFMGIQPCEIEFDRFLLLIGEQASGKSTIAKLIYFFQGLPDAIYQEIADSYMEVSIGKQGTFLPISVGLTWKFEQIFNQLYEDFNLEFHYESNLIIECDYNSEYNNKYPIHDFVNVESTHLDSISEQYYERRKQGRNSSNSESIKLTSQQQLLKDINQLFSRKTTDQNYLIAGRNNIVAFSEYFEIKVKADMEKLMEDEVKKQNLQRKIRGGNEKLLLEFVNWASDIRKYFQYNGGTFKAVKSDLENKEALNLFEKIFAKILKAAYRHDSNGEFLKLKDKQKVFMRDASSGQQEVLRVLQGLFLSVGLKNRREFFVVEEPETHLYPLAQKELINAFALFLNTIKEGRLIITTHSPYILACVNILLFAHYVAKEAPKQKNSILKEVPKDFWLDSNMFSAYSLGQEGAYCKNIKDAETGLIDQTYLDLISEQLGLQYQQLYNILVANHV